jgi:glutaredoxin
VQILPNGERFFQKNNVAYQEFDVGKDLEKRKEMIEKSGQMGVPVIMVGDEMVVGFNKPRLESLLNISCALKAIIPPNRIEISPLNSRPILNPKTRNRYSSLKLLPTLHWIAHN